MNEQNTHASSAVTVSVVIPAYNAERFLPDAVQSVLNQTFSDWELLIIDDCSTDRTAEIAASYAARDDRVILMRNEQNCGASASRHRGVQAAQGEWIAFLDSDDVWAPEKLELQLAHARQTEAKLVFTASAFMHEDGSPYAYVMPVPETVDYAQLCRQNVISNSSVMVDRSLFLRYELVGPDMHEDYACWLNLLRSGEIAYGINTPMLTYRVSSASKSGNKFRAAKMNWNTYRRVGMDRLTALYYMAWYTVRGLKKYSHLR